MLLRVLAVWLLLANLTLALAGFGPGQVLAPADPLAWAGAELGAEPAPPKPDDTALATASPADPDAPGRVRGIRPAARTAPRRPHARPRARAPPAPTEA